MNQVKVVIIYKLQTKQGTIIDIANRNVLGSKTMRLISYLLFQR